MDHRTEIIRKKWKKLQVDNNTHSIMENACYDIFQLLGYIKLLENSRLRLVHRVLDLEDSAPIPTPNQNLAKK